MGYVRDTCHDIHKPTEKLVVVTPINKKNTTRVVDTVASSSNMPKVTNRPLLSSTGVKPSTSASESKPSCNTKIDRILRTPSSNDLLSGSQGTNLYSLSSGDMMASSICLLSKATKTKSWLWHRRLSHLNIGALNHLARNGLVRGLPRHKFKKDHLCSACAMGKSKKQSHKRKSKDTNQEKLYLLHMDLCGPMHVASINGKNYILVIVYDYSRFTWVKFLALKDEAPDFIIKFLKMIQVRLNAAVRNIRTDNGTKFVNQTLQDYYEQVDISHKTSVARTPQQNSVVKLQNRTLVEVARIIKPNLSYLYVFGALCYPNNDSENLGKLQAKADIGIFIGYALKKKAYHIYNRRTRKIIKTIHVDFDELTDMASEQSCLEPALHEMTPATPSSGLVPNPPPSAPFVPPLRHQWALVFQLLFDEFYSPPASVASLVLVEKAPAPVESTSLPSSTTVDQDAPYLKTVSEESSSSDVISTTVHLDAPISEHPIKWTKDHPIQNIMDVKTAFLNGILREEAPRAWYDLLSSFLLSQGFSKGTIDPTLFISRKGKDILMMSMMGKISFFLGLQISHSPRGIFLNQPKYALELLKKYGIESCDPVDTPMVEKSKLDEDT
nr:retrovirus-related Pol polyprotein from transposon TNT 1-94 [Tanacetum cinerariifolium]